MLEQFYKYLLKNQVIMALSIIVLGWFVLQIRDILVSLFLAYIIMAAMLPFVRFLREKGLPKILAILIPYLLLSIFIFVLILPLIPFFAEQIKQLFVTLPKYLDQSLTIFGVKIDPRQIQSYINSEINNLGQNAFEVTGRVFGGIFSTLSVIIISFYLLVYQENFNKGFINLFESDTKKTVTIMLEHVNDKLGAWLRGQLLLSFSIGLASFLGLTLLGIPYALPLSLLAGFLEIVPTIGPIISAVPAVIVAMTISPSMALIVVGLYLIIQTLENHILVPKIMQRAVGLNPIVVILGIGIGAQLMGIMGALLIVPFISFVIVLFKGIIKGRHALSTA